MKISIMKSTQMPKGFEGLPNPEYLIPTQHLKNTNRRSL